MNATKKEVIIVSSEYGNDYASVLQEELDNEEYAILERQILGFPMQNKLEKLINELKNSDFGIAVIVDRDIEPCSKDMVFLAGLLAGNLGLKRFAILVPYNYNINCISNYLNGLEPNFYDIGNTDKKMAISQAILNIKETLEKIEKRKSDENYKILENKKELLRIALIYHDHNDKYNLFLSHLVNYFRVDGIFINAKVLGATLFCREDNFLEQIGTAGVISKHSYSMDEKDKYVVQCISQENELLLGEKYDRLTDDDESYEYIFCKSIFKKYVLTVHINCKSKIRNEDYLECLQRLQQYNAAYISVLQLFLKEGINGGGF